MLDFQMAPPPAPDEPSNPDPGPTRWKYFTGETLAADVSLTLVLAEVADTFLLSGDLGVCESHLAVRRGLQ